MDATPAALGFWWGMPCPLSRNHGLARVHGGGKPGVTVLLRSARQVECLSDLDIVSLVGRRRGLAHTGATALVRRGRDAKTSRRRQCWWEHDAAVAVPGDEMSPSPDPVGTTELHQPCPAAATTSYATSSTKWSRDQQIRDISINHWILIILIPAPLYTSQCRKETRGSRPLRSHAAVRPERVWSRSCTSLVSRSHVCILFYLASFCWPKQTYPAGAHTNDQVFPGRNSDGDQPPCTRMCLPFPPVMSDDHAHDPCMHPDE